MKIKQTLLLFSPLLLVATLFSAVLAPSPTALALTNKEKKACYTKWAGRSVGTAGDGEPFDETKFNKDECSAKKKGSCKIVRYEDGAVIHCLNVDTGEYDNGTPVEPEDESDGGGGTTTDPVAGDGCGGVKTSIIKCSEDNSGGVETNGVWGLLLIVISIMTAGVGVLAVGGIVYGAILYSTAEDNASQVKQATDIITNVVIGLVAFALMWAGLNFLIPGGVFA